MLLQSVVHGRPVSASSGQWCKCRSVGSRPDQWTKVCKSGEQGSALVRGSPCHSDVDHFTVLASHRRPHQTSTSGFVYPLQGLRVGCLATWRPQSPSAFPFHFPRLPFPLVLPSEAVKNGPGRIWIMFSGAKNWCKKPAGQFLQRASRVPPSSVWLSPSPSRGHFPLRSRD